MHTIGKLLTLRGVAVRTRVMQSSSASTASVMLSDVTCVMQGECLPQTAIAIWRGQDHTLSRAPLRVAAVTWHDDSAKLNALEATGLLPSEGEMWGRVHVETVISVICNRWQPAVW